MAKLRLSLVVAAATLILLAVNVRAQITQSGLHRARGKNGRRRQTKSGTRTSRPRSAHTGWDLARKGFVEDQQCTSAGSFIPPQPPGNLLVLGDPRLIIDERYPDHVPTCAPCPMPPRH